MNADQASTELQYLFSDLEESWRDAFSTQEARYNDPAFTKSTRAGILQNLCFANMQVRLHSRGGHHFVTLEQRGLLIVEQRAVLAFKKFDDQLRCNSHNDSRLAEAFFGQQELPGIPTLVHLVCGVVVTESWSAISGTYLTCPSSLNSNSWSLELNNGEGGSRFATLPLDGIDPVRPRFVPRRSTQDDASATGSQ